MSEMVERVAKAMAAQRNDANGAGAVMDAYGDLARAAIEAMREPTFDPETVSYHRGMTRADWWRAMIDVALKE